MLAEVLEPLCKQHNCEYDRDLNFDMETYPDEEFIDIIINNIDYTGLYEISNYGRVWSIKRQKFLSPAKSPNGYLHVTLCKYRVKNKTYTIHKLVLTAFKRPSGLNEECRHLDRNKQNNHIDNLEWGYNEDNYNDRIRHGTENKSNENHPNSVLTNDQVKEIREKYSTGKYSQRDLARIYSVTQANIWHIVNNKTRII